MKYVAFCAKCDSHYNVDHPEDTCLCSYCGDKMVVTDISADDFISMSADMKKAVKTFAREKGSGMVTLEEVKHAEEEKNKEREHQKQEEDEKLKIAAGQFFNADLDTLDPKVADYLKKKAKIKLENEKKYRESVLAKNGFTHKEKREVGPNEYYNCTEEKNDVTHYYAVDYVIDDVTPEEYELILKASGMQKKSETVQVSSGAAAFFMVIAIVVWVFGLIISILMADAARNNEFAVFMENFLTYGMYGCLAFCASELFRRLAKIQSLLTSIRDRLKDDD